MRALSTEYFEGYDRGGARCQAPNEAVRYIGMPRQRGAVRREMFAHTVKHKRTGMYILVPERPSNV